MVLSAKCGRTQEHAAAAAEEELEESILNKKKDPKILPKNCQSKLESSSYQ